jgi:hypothetical protein
MTPISASLGIFNSEFLGGKDIDIWVAENRWNIDIVSNPSGQ